MLPIIQISKLSFIFRCIRIKIITTFYILLLVVMWESAAVRVLVMFSPLLVRYGAVYCVFIASTIKYQFKLTKISAATLLQATARWWSTGRSLAECLLIIVLLSPLTNLLSGYCYVFRAISAIYLAISWLYPGNTYRISKLGHLIICSH